VEKISIAVNNYFSSLEGTGSAASPEAGEAATQQGGEVGEAAAQPAATEPGAPEYTEQASEVAGALEDAAPPQQANNGLAGGPAEVPVEQQAKGAAETEAAQQEEQKSEEEPS
jgi:hypothetical protein